MYSRDWTHLLGSFGICRLCSVIARRIRGVLIVFGEYRIPRRILASGCRIGRIASATRRRFRYRDMLTSLPNLVGILYSFFLIVNNLPRVLFVGVLQELIHILLPLLLALKRLVCRIGEVHDSRN